MANSSKKVMIVDDSASIRQQVREALGSVGFEVVEASDGMIGLQRAAEHDLAMIILDVNMPLLNGLEMLERLQLDPVKSKVPVLMLTTEAQRSIIDRARRAGAKGWLVKPIKMEHVVSAVRKIVGDPRSDAFSP